MEVNPLDKNLMHRLAEMLRKPDDKDPDRSALEKMNRRLTGEEDPPEEPKAPPFEAQEIR